MSENNFEWNETLIKEYANFVYQNTRPQEFFFHDDLMKQFKSSKSSKGVDFEILKIQNKHSGAVFSEINNGDIDFINWSIHSVKRLSDGVEFKVGDRFSNNTGNFTYEFTIISFGVYPNGLHVKYSDDESYYLLKDISPLPLKKVLFTTEDGVDIEKDGHAYYIEPQNNWMVVSHSGITIKRPYKYFSTSEKAHEYILLNKPCISVNEILKLDVGESSGVWNVVEIEALKQLAKSKIK